jgi:hypothetical protein
LNRQDILHSFFKPGLSVFGLTLGAGAVITGMVGIGYQAAFLAYEDVSAQNLGSAVHDIGHGSMVTGRHGLTVFVYISLSVTPEDVC